MTFLIVAGSVTAYLAVSLWSMRALYGRWRASSIDNGTRNYPSLYPTAQKAVEYFDSHDRGVVMVAAAATSLVWPAVLPALAIGAVCSRVMASTTVLSRTEHRALVREQAQRIAELERELGIGR